MSQAEPHVEAAIIARCIALGTPAGNRVYREFIPRELTPDELPAIMVTRFGGGPAVRAAGAPPAMYRADVRVEIIALSLDSLEAVGDALVAGLDQWKGTLGGVTVLVCYVAGILEGSAEVQGDQVLRIRQIDLRIMFR